jgi:predicted TPR repeat methyltransferase
MTSSDRVTQARSLRSPDDAVQLYGSWAGEYDHDVFEVLGFTGTHRVAELLAHHLPDHLVPVVDLGCGTGVAGEQLAQHGFITIDGIDISPEMLDVATARGAYRHLVCADLTSPLDIEHRYGGSVSAGTFTTGHVGADALPSIASLLHDDAVVAWVVAEVLWPSFEPAMASLGFRMLHVALESIRRDAPPEAMMVVATRA